MHLLTGQNRRQIFSIIACYRGPSSNSNNLMPLPSHCTMRYLFDEEKCIIIFYLKDQPSTPLFSAKTVRGDIRRDKKIWGCRKASCRKGVSIFTGSFFTKTKLRCNEVLVICYLWLIKATGYIYSKLNTPCNRLSGSRILFFK
jgi:hypothetical protein